jgi:ABC-type branched-subunit amino acid transport system ATPase component
VQLGPEGRPAAVMDREPGEPPVLSVTGLTRRFGGVVAVDDLSFAVLTRSALGIIGPNGAGKTTLLNLISGLDTPDQGDVALRGQSILGRPPHVVSRLGVGRTFQTVRVFHDLTLLENLRVADLYTKSRASRSFAERTHDVLDLVGLQGREATRASALSYGQQKLLELAVVLMAEPELLLLDEPVAGVNPVLVETIGDLLKQLVARGLSVVVIEHNIPFVVSCCETVLVMANGRRLAEGTGAEIQRDQRVLDAFLGGA